jgi:hypothetical protein
MQIIFKIGLRCSFFNFSPDEPLVLYVYISFGVGISVLEPLVGLFLFISLPHQGQYLNGLAVYFGAAARLAQNI